MTTARGRPRRLVAVVLLSLAPIEAAGYAGRVTSPPGGPGAPAAALPGVQISRAPWPAEHAQLAARLHAIGMPALSEEGSALHTHQHLDVFVAARRVQVPSDIGIDADKRFIAPLHTHDTSGVIHIESPTVETFTLGQFFDVWGVRFDDTCLGAYCAKGDHRVRVYADGRLVHGDPRRLPLTPHEEIVVAYGALTQVPRPIPSTYKFAKGL